MKHARRWSMILLLALTAVFIAQAQDADSIGIGDTVEGTLDEDTPRALYTLDIATTTDVTITLESDEFDAYLLLLDDADEIIAEDDDSAGRLNSEIETTLDEGTYTVIATSLREYRSEGDLFASGDYTLTVAGEGEATATPMPPSATPTVQVSATFTPSITTTMVPPSPTAVPTEVAQREISVGGSASGTLSEGNTSDDYLLPLEAGETITITLVSEDFDTFVLLFSPDGFEVARDDDSAGDLDSQIADFTVQMSGDYTIEVTSFGAANDLPAGFGDYTLTVETGEAVVETQPTIPLTPTAAPGEVDPEAVTVSQGTVTTGEIIEGTLTDDELAHEYTLSAVEGEIVTVDLQADFDTYLTMSDSEGNVVTFNDDGGEGLNSLISGFVIPETGEYIIQASSYGFVRGFTPGTGDYTLDIRAGEAVAQQVPTSTPAPLVTEAVEEVPEEGVPVGAIAIDDSLTGELSESEPAHGYSFDLTTSETVTIDLQADFDTYLRVFDDTGEIVTFDDDGGEGLNSRIESFTFQPGTYTVNVSSFGYVRGFTPGYGEYTVTVEADDAVVQATPTLVPTVAPDDTDSEIIDMGTIQIGDTVTGDLNESDRAEEYTFTGNEGDVVTITVISEELDTWVFLFEAETGETLISNDDADNIELGLNSQIVGYELPFTGDYIIGVTTYGFVQGFEAETGDYTLTLESGVAVAQQATPTITPTLSLSPTPTPFMPPTDDENVAFAGTITYGETITNSLTDDALAQEYTFDATVGDLVTIDMQSDIIDTYLLLFDENDNEVTFDDDGGDGLNSLIENFEIPDTGEYTIRASSFGFVRGFTPDTGEYTLTLTSESSEFVSDPTEIAVGDVVQETLTSDEVVEEYELFAEAGDVISITLTSEEFDTYLFLFDENRNEVARDDDSAGSLDSRIGPLEISQDGVYTIQVNSYPNVTRSEFSGGAYTLRVDATEPQPIEYTQSIQGTIDNETPVELYEFTGEEGDIVTLALDTTNQSLYARLTGAEGQVRAEAYSNVVAGPVTLPEDGTYLITVGSFNLFEPASYTLTLDSIIPQEIAYGDELETNFDDDRALYYSFEGAEGDILNLSVDSDGTVDTRLRLIGPGGFEVIGDDDSGEGFDPEVLNFRLFEDGTYTLVVAPYISGDNGDITVTVDSSGLTEIDTEAQIIRLSDKQPFAVASFDAEAGETFLLSARVLVAPQGEPRITIRQDGEVIASNAVGQVSRLLLEFTIEDSGEVIVEVDSGGGTGAILEVEVQPAEE